MADTSPIADPNQLGIVGMLLGALAFSIRLFFPDWKLNIGKERSSQAIAATISLPSSMPDVWRHNIKNIVEQENESTVLPILGKLETQSIKLETQSERQTAIQSRQTEILAALQENIRELIDMERRRRTH